MLRLSALLCFLAAASGMRLATNVECIEDRPDEVTIKFEGKTLRHNNLGGVGCGWFESGGAGYGCWNTPSEVCPNSTSERTQWAGGGNAPSSAISPSKSGMVNDMCSTAMIFGNVTDPPAEWKSRNGLPIVAKDETGAVVSVVDLHVETTTDYPNWVRLPCLRLLRSRLPFKEGSARAIASPDPTVERYQWKVRQDQHRRA
jgi:hypothetical protein